MKINIKAIQIDLTPALNVYIEKKLSQLAKFVKRFDETGEAEIWLEISRSTRHKKGDVFETSADLRLPKKILRAETVSPDARAAIDVIKNKLSLEIQKYRTQFLEIQKKRLPGKR
ncbi:MAG: ribosome-associated translation inhibitor RaiA [Patescibacteria group bacterium]